MPNVNTIIYEEDLSILSQTSQPIRAYAEQANTIEAYAPVSEFNTAFIIYQGLKGSVVNPRLRATERLYMTDVGEVTLNGVPYHKWQHTVPGAVLNDASLMKCTGLRIQIELWYTDGDFIGVEKYNVETGIADLLAADYPTATEGQIVRVIDTDTDWILTDGVLTDFEDKKSDGIVREPTASSDFTLERSIYTTAPTTSPTNDELIINELNKKLAKAGDTMTGDLDMDGNDVDNVKSVTLYSATGNIVFTTDGTKLNVNIGGVDYTYAVKEADNIFE